MIFNDGDRIIFAGDSITDMGSQQPVGDGHSNLGNSYVRIIHTLLVASYPELKIRTTNSGVSGNTSRDLLKRFDRDITELNPDWVSICIGVNDVWRQFDNPEVPDWQVLPEEYEKNMRTMIEKVKDKVKGIFILTPYIMEPCVQDAMRIRMDEYGDICKKLAQEYNCILVDLQSVFSNFCKMRYSATIAYDRIHPNQIGAMLIAKEFLSKCDYKF